MNRDALRTNNAKGDLWRLFIAVPLPDGVRDLMVDAQAGLRSGDWPVKWVEPELAHVTLKFLGNVETSRIAGIEQALDPVMSGYQAIGVATGALGAFPTATRPRVFWLGLYGNLKPLERLAGDVDRAMAGIGFEPESRPFRPHITLGRLRKEARPPADFERVAAAIRLPRLDVRFDRVELVRSVLGRQGPAYTTLQQWPLGSTVVELVEHG